MNSRNKTSRYNFGNSSEPDKSNNYQTILKWSIIVGILFLFLTIQIHDSNQSGRNHSVELALLAGLLFLVQVIVSVLSLVLAVITILKNRDGVLLSIINLTIWGIGLMMRF